MSEIKYQLLKIKVSTSGESIKFSADSDKKYNRLTGLFASLPDTGNAMFGSTLEFKIADKEIFPEDFEIKMISCGQNVATNERFYDQLDEEAQGNRLEGRFTDGGNASSYPYTAKLYLRLEEKN